MSDVFSVNATRFLVYPPGSKDDRSAIVPDDDAAEGSHRPESSRESKGGQKKERSKGQNTGRKFGSSRDGISLCQSRANSPEFHPGTCQYGDGCRFEHDLRKYLRDWKREDLRTFGGICPIWAVKGRCHVGWKCRFVGSHMKEVESGDGRMELVLVEVESKNSHLIVPAVESSNTGILNTVSTQNKADLMKRKIKTPKSDEYEKWLERSSKETNQSYQNGTDRDIDPDNPDIGKTDITSRKVSREQNRAQYTEPPFLPSEKRKIYFGPETPVLAPLTTQGNLPFRRLCIDLGAQITYSEMAIGLPLIQGQKSEWALMRAHDSEAASPAYKPKAPIVTDYDNKKDFRFGAQIAANKSWQALKTTEILTNLCPHLRVIDLNCGCPIDLICRTGAGSALLDSQSKLEKMVRGMNAVSGEVPITIKIRTGTKDNKPSAYKLVERLVYGGSEFSEFSGGSSGVAAITLHGRSKQQRYTKNANWEYISDCAALIKRFNEKGDDVSDTIREAEARTQPNGKVYFVGNGDCYSHVDYNTHLTEAKVDSVMIARGALIKPWIFEEIERGQNLDKSATERLALVEQFVRYGLETWGSDEMGIGTTRRFLLEWLSFAHRYVPIGILEYLPPNSMQCRPPAWRGRNDLETLLGSNNYRDWVKIRYDPLFVLSIAKRV